MSWSITTEGKPEEVVAKLNEYSGSLTGGSKDEFDAAMPHIVGLVNENRKKEGTQHTGPVKVRVSGFGSRSTTDGVEQTQSCSVKVEPINE